MRFSLDLNLSALKRHSLKNKIFSDLILTVDSGDWHGRPWNSAVVFGEQSGDQRNNIKLASVLFIRQELFLLGRLPLVGGVPQGSVLGLHLFSPHCICCTYAEKYNVFFNCYVNWFFFKVRVHSSLDWIEITWITWLALIFLKTLRKRKYVFGPSGLLDIMSLSY